MKNSCHVGVQGDSFHGDLGKQGDVLKLGVHYMQQASRKAEPGDYKHAVNDM